MTRKDTQAKTQAAQELTTTQAAAEFNIRRDRLPELVRKGKIAGRIGTLAGSAVKAIFIERSSLEAYIANHPAPVESVVYDRVSCPIELKEAFERFMRERNITYRVKHAVRVEAPKATEATDDATDDADDETIDAA